ncbi:hypothetical protein NPIL_568591 [Nephila pilipes]|uniref:Uncharacterized protein n=1 Tax=Nephila pilipes TaxID=299642 RepID=A0A8X6T4C9_NEPPI|nr:hypothetical protein NPIL_568591 [Nephila pilipes]
MKSALKLTDIIEEYETIKESFKKGDFPKKCENTGLRRYFSVSNNTFQCRGASNRKVRNVKQEPKHTDQRKLFLVVIVRRNLHVMIVVLQTI